MKILVTGAQGFVGRSLCEFLLKDGFTVSATGRSDSSSLPENIDYVAADLVIAPLPDSFFASVDCVVHLAGMADQGAGLSLGDFRKINVAPTLELARRAIDLGVRRFVFVSSIVVHGAKHLENPISESSPLNPTTAYAYSKLEAEQKLNTLFSEAENSELVIVRPPLVYDASARGNFRRLLGLASSGLPLPFGCCVNRRSLISLENLTRFLAVCCNDSAAAGETFVVSDGGEPVSTAEIILALRSGMGRPSRLLPIPLFVMKSLMSLVRMKGMYYQLFGDSYIDIGKAVELLAWSPGKDSLTQLQEVGRQYMDAAAGT